MPVRRALLVQPMEALAMNELSPTTKGPAAVPGFRLRGDTAGQDRRCSLINAARHTVLLNASVVG